MQPDRPLRSLPALSLALLLLLLPAAHAAQQQRFAIEVARQDQTFANGDVLDGFESVRVNDLGQWAAHVTTTTPSGGVGARILFHGATAFRDGQVAPGTGGAVITGILDFDLDDTGRLTAAVELPAGFALYYGNQLVLREDDPATAPGFGATARFIGVTNVEANANHQLLLRCSVFDSTHTTAVSHCLVRLDLGPSGAILSQRLLIRTDDVPAGQSGALYALSFEDRGASFLDDGRGTWSGELDGGSLPGEFVTYQNAGTLLYQSEAPSLVNGRDWSIDDVEASASNLAGSYAFAASLDGSNTNDDDVVVKDGAIRFREDRPYPGLPGNPTINLIGPRCISLTDDGDVICALNVDAGIATYETHIVREDRTLLGTGDSIYGGGEVLAVSDALGGFHASGNGQFLVATAYIVNQGLALVYVQDELGVPYCAAQTNSTGQRALTSARGVSLVSEGELELVTNQAPPGSFGYYLTSRTQGDVLFPGGSSGRICLAGSIGRFVSQVGPVNPSGQYRRIVDLTSFPTSPNVAVQPGDTWNFQMWFRDAGPTGATSNFSLPIAVAFH